MRSVRGKTDEQRTRESVHEQAAESVSSEIKSSELDVEGLWPSDLLQEVKWSEQFSQKSS